MGVGVDVDQTWQGWTNAAQGCGSEHTCRRGPPGVDDEIRLVLRRRECGTKPRGQRTMALNSNGGSCDTLSDALACRPEEATPRSELGPAILFLPASQRHTCLRVGCCQAST